MFQAFKDANMHSHVKSHKLVHIPGVHCHMCASSKRGCAFAYFTVILKIFFFIFYLLFVQKVLKTYYSRYPVVLFGYLG